MEIPPMEPLQLKKEIDFFVSYNKADHSWAEWIAWQLEEAGYDVVLQDWDFRPGSNFPLEMDRATREAKRIILVLSPDYLRSVYTAPEWAAFFAQDSTGKQHKLLPVRVQECNPLGLLRQIVQIDLLGLDESAARKKLLEDINAGRGKPIHPPAFPAKHKLAKQPSFPRTPLKKVPIAPAFRKKTISLPVPKNYSQDFWIKLGKIVGVLLVVSLIILMIYAFISSAIYDTTVNSKLDKFCDAMAHHDYDIAYSYFDASLQKQVSKSLFLASIHMVADKHDSIGQCTYSVVNEIGSIAHVKITYAFGDGSMITQRYELFQDGYGNWGLNSWIFSM